MKAETAYQQLKPMVLQYLTAYQTDFTFHDRKALKGYRGKFLYAIRKTGTHLIKLQDEPFSEGRLHKIYVRFGSPEQYLMSLLPGITRGNERFFVYDHGELNEISAEQFKAIALTHARDKKAFFMYL